MTYGGGSSSSRSMVRRRRQLATVAVTEGRWTGRRRSSRGVGLQCWDLVQE